MPRPHRLRDPTARLQPGGGRGVKEKALVDTIIETERLSIRKIGHRDFSALCAIFQNEAVMYAWEHTFTTSEIEAWLAECMLRYERDGFSYWAVIEKATGDFIGVAGLFWEEAEGEPHIGVGYIFNNQYWHKGYAFEAASACVRYGFDTLGLPAITAQIRPTNAGSIRIAEKLGMTVIRPFIRHYRGHDLPHLLYGRERKAEL